VKGSFVPSKLRETYSDLLFEASLRFSPEDQEKIFVYLLFEHKSAAGASTSSPEQSSIHTREMTTDEEDRADEEKRRDRG